MASASIKAGGQGDQAESQIATSSLLLTLKETPNAEVEGLLRQHIFVRFKNASVERTLAPAIHLPQAVILRLDEANIVQIDIGGGIRSSRVAA